MTRSEFHRWARYTLGFGFNDDDAATNHTLDEDCPICCPQHDVCVLTLVRSMVPLETVKR